MKTILVVNGEKYWADLLDDYKVVQKSIQNSHWILKNGKLYITDSEGTVQPDGILWRVGAIKPGQNQVNAMNLIHISGIPCVNSASTLKKGYDRLSMLGIIKNLGLPVIDFEVVSHPNLMHNIKRDYPFVIKVGNYHGGFGKVLVRDDAQWQEVKDFAFVTDHYVTTEPFIDYVNDIRYLVIGAKVWAMSRKGKFWKANVETTEFKIIEPQPEFVVGIKKLQQAIEADILAIDILEDAQGNMHIVEYNDIPGISGFSDELKYELAEIVRQKVG